MPNTEDNAVTSVPKLAYTHNNVTSSEHVQPKLIVKLKPPKIMATRTKPKKTKDTKLDTTKYHKISSMFKRVPPELIEKQATQKVSSSEVAAGLLSEDNINTMSDMPLPNTELDRIEQQREQEPRKTEESIFSTSSDCNVAQNSHGDKSTSQSCNNIQPDTCQISQNGREEQDLIPNNELVQHLPGLAY